MKLFATSAIGQLDKYTIEHDPISSTELMERAADALFWEFTAQSYYQRSVCLFAGPGNNGGDTLALARMLLHAGFQVSVILIHSGSLSPDCEINRQRLLKLFPENLTELTAEFTAPEILPKTILVDGLFGSGLSRPLDGLYADAVNWMNKSGCTIISIDISSGLSGEENDLSDSSAIVKADLTLSLQFPKLAFFFAENAPYVGEWKIIDIGLHPQAIEQTPSEFYYLEEEDITPLIIKRPTFGHKGTFGHACIVAGRIGMAGSAVLAAKAALRCGAGLVTVHSAAANRSIIQTTIPEALFITDHTSDYITDVIALEPYNVLAVGPGIGKHIDTARMLRKLLENHRKSCVLDADALNIIAEQKDLLHRIHRNSILTPHPKEFERLFGQSKNSFERMTKAQRVAQQFSIIIVLKGAYTLIATPDGKLFFNSTGNPGMGTAGSGDVLTGILAGLLAQGYVPEEAAKIGVFIHGRAGDLALRSESVESLLASDIIARLGNAFQSVKTIK